MTTTALTIADIADKAADVIEVNGYCKWSLYNFNQFREGIDPKRCQVDVIGAINIAIHGTPLYNRTGQGWAVEQAVEAHISAPSIASWCSRRGNGKTEAIRLLRDTAANLRVGATA